MPCRGYFHRIHFKNENIISYLNDAVDVVVPDLICMLDKDGNPFTTPNFYEGMEVNVFALPAPKVWTTEKGLKCLARNILNWVFPIFLLMQQNNHKKYLLYNDSRYFFYFLTKNSTYKKYPWHCF